MQSKYIWQTDQRLLKSAVLSLFLNLFFLQITIAQCAEPDANIWLNTWVSCNKKMNPMAEYGSSHWIQYDLGAVRTLSKTWVWNTNDPNRLDQGFKQVRIDYSRDGRSWTSWGEMTFPKAQGKAVYGGFSGPDLVNIKARYVLLTALSTYGSDCAGLAEVKFNLLPEIVASPAQFSCETAKPISSIFLEELEETEALIVWESEIPEPYLEDIEFFFEVRPFGLEEWFELEPEEAEVFLEDLEPGTTYEYRVLLACEEQLLFSDIKSFTTLSDIATDTNSQYQLAESMQIAPNPTKADFRLHYFSPLGGQLDFSIKDLQGTTILQSQRKLVAGDNTFSFNLGAYPDGIYLVSTFSENRQVNLVERVVKISN